MTYQKCGGIVELTKSVRKGMTDLELAQKYKVDVVELKKIMVEQKLDKIIDLSAASMVDRNTLSKILNEDIKPSTTVIEKLMSALHIPPERAGAIFFSLNLRKS